MSIFTGFKLRTPVGHLSEDEQRALIKFVLARVAVQPDIANEVKLVLEGRRDICNLSPDTLSVLRQITNDFFAAGKPRTDSEPVFAAPIKLAPTI